MNLDPDFNNHFLLQLFSCKDKLNLTLSEMLENIFNIYDYNGDGVLDKEEYITFISDLLYISLLMNRISESDYTLDIVLKVSNWSSSNFKTNLFRIPNDRIHHDKFLTGILEALTETKNSTIFPNSSLYLNSLVPELIHYFDYYVQLANRRGWPTEMLPEENKENGEHAITIIENPAIEETDTINNIIDPSDNLLENTITPEQQMNDYRERHKQKLKDKKDKEEQAAKDKEDERQRIIKERHDREDLVQQQLHAQQQQQAAQFQERQRQIQQEELQERQRQIQLRILQQQLQRIQTLQHQFREHLRKKHEEQHINQLDDGESVLESAGKLEISPDTEGFEVIEGNVNIIKYIEEDKEDHISFQIGHAYFLASKKQIRSMINQGDKGNSLFYGCLCEIEDDWTLPTTWALLEQTVITNTIYFSMSQLGLPIRYVNLKEIIKVLNSADNYFLIEKPKDEMLFPSFASDDILNHGMGSMSGSHCQDGQMDIIYVIKRYE